MTFINIKVKESIKLKIEGKKLLLTKVIRYPSGRYFPSTEEVTFSCSPKEAKKIYKFLHSYYNKST